MPYVDIIIVSPHFIYIKKMFLIYRCKDWVQRLRRDDLMKKDVKLLYSSGVCIICTISVGVKWRSLYFLLFYYRPGKTFIDLV